MTHRDVTGHHRDMTPERDITRDDSKWPKNGGGSHGGHGGGSNRFGNNGNDQNGTRKPKIVDERNKNELDTAKSWNDNGANVSQTLTQP